MAMTYEEECALADARLAQVQEMLKRVEAAGRRVSRRPANPKRH